MDRIKECLGARGLSCAHVKRVRPSFSGRFPLATIATRSSSAVISWNSLLSGPDASASRRGDVGEVLGFLCRPDSEQFRSSPRTFQPIRRIVPDSPRRARLQSAEVGPRWRGQKRLTLPRRQVSGKPEDRTMSTSGGVQKRNAFAVCAAFRIENLEASLGRARQIAFQEELEAVGHHIEEAQGYLAQIRVLHQEALEEFSRAQGE
jgi:hypothetical protein